MANQWYRKFIPGNSKDQELKSLKDKVESISGELNDLDSYEAKFYDAEPSSSFAGSMFELGGIDQVVNSALLQRIFITETWVYVAIMAIAKTVAGLPIKGEKKTKVKQKVISDVTGEIETVEQEVWVDASGEKVFKCFTNPNKFTTKAEFFALLLIDLLSCGQYFVCLDSDADLTAIAASTGNDSESPFARLRQLLESDTPIKAMYRIPPQLIKPMPSENGPGVEVYAMESQEGTFAFSPGEIIHVKLPNPANVYEGLSPLIPAFKPILLDRYSTEHIIRFYKSGARLGGVIETQKTLNKEQLGRFQRSFENNYTGRQNHHRTLILPPGMSYKQVEANPAETALLEFCKYNREAILSVFNVPPIKVGIMDNANYANANVQLKVFFEDTIKPLLTFVEDGFNNKPAMFADSQTYRMKFDLSQVESLKDNFKDKAAAAVDMIKSGLTVNEVRKRVWGVGPIAKGEKCFVIEEMDKKSPGFFPIGAGAEPGKEKAEDQADAALIASDINPTKVTFAQRVEQLTKEFMEKGDPLNIALAKAIAQAIKEGFDPEDPEGGSSGSAPNSDGSGSPDQATPPKDESKLDSGSAAAWIPTNVGAGKPKKPKDEEDDEEKANGLSLDQFLRDRLSQMGNAPIDAAVISSLITEYEVGAPAAPKMYANGMTKDHVVEHWKSFISKTDPLIDKREGEVRKFFKSIQTIVMNKLGAHIKSYGIHKSPDEDDIEEILKLSNFDDVLKKYAKEIDDALKEAYEYGFVDTLGNFKFDLPNEDAIKQLSQYAASRVKGILDTTREQLKDLLVESFKEGASVTEISSRIQDKFKEMSTGRANTIARTETLTAVSMGREEKRQEFKEQFPDRKLMKMWVSAQDDKVRDTHEQYDGTSVEAGDEFAPGLKFPRDPDCTDAAEVINCRCTDITYDSEDKDLVESTLSQSTTENDSEQ